MATLSAHVQVFGPGTGRVGTAVARNGRHEGTTGSLMFLTGLVWYHDNRPWTASRKWSLHSRESAAI